MPRPIALLSDFGSADGFVGAVKCVLLSRCPQATLIDLTHEIAPHDVFGGALILRACAPYAPVDTVFLAVVDPGVGSERRAICIRSGSRLFVGPDNGLLWPAAAQFGEPECWELYSSRFRLPNPTPTFHGRDVFAPAAAALALGRAPEDFGPEIQDPAPLHFPEPIRATDSPDAEVVGEVLHVDRYGNCLTNITPVHLDDPGINGWTFHWDGGSVDGPAPCYASVPVGRPVVVLSSLGSYELALREGNAARTLKLRRGSRLTATR